MMIRVARGEVAAGDTNECAAASGVLACAAEVGLRNSSVSDNLVPKILKGECPVREEDQRTVYGPVMQEEGLGVLTELDRRRLQNLTPGQRPEDTVQ
jgi:hypothetical protein